MIGRVTTNTKETTKCHYCASWQISQIYCLHGFLCFRDICKAHQLSKYARLAIFPYSFITHSMFRLGRARMDQELAILRMPITFNLNQFDIYPWNMYLHKAWYTNVCFSFVCWSFWLSNNTVIERNFFCISCHISWTLYSGILSRISIDKSIETKYDIITTIDYVL